jgi:ribonuclease VapC
MSGLVVDTSAAVAVLAGETAGAGIIEHLDAATTRVMSAATMVELGIVLEARFGPVGSAVVDRFLRDAAVEVVAVDEDQARAAIAAWRRYGRDKHPAALNLGDCFTYALAAARSLPVLCVGNDFAATDLEAIVPGD